MKSNSNQPLAADLTQACGDPSEESADWRTVDNCEALIVCLQGGRFAIIRPDQCLIMRPVEPLGKDLRKLAVGDDVLYRGRLSTVVAVDVYC